MLKNILIVSVLILLLATISNLTPIRGQELNNSKNTEKQGFESSPNNSDDYHRTVNERLVINTLKKLYDAEAKFVMTSGGGNFGTLELLGYVNLIDSVLASGRKYGYDFSIEPRLGSSGVFPGFYIKATPAHYGRTGKNSFYMDSKCLVHGADKSGVEADFNDPIVDNCSPYIAYQWEYDISLSIRQLYKAQQEYFVGVGNGTYGTLRELIEAEYINYAISGSWGWWIYMELTPPTKQSAADFKIWGTPQVYRETGIRSYYIDQTGILRGDDIQGDFADETTQPIFYEDEVLIKYAMRSLWNAQRLYPCLSPTNAGCINFSTNFEQLTKARLIDFEIVNGEFGGYRFEMKVFNSDDSWTRDFQIKATPINYENGTKRSFYISRKSFLRGEDKGGKTADENDPIVEF